LGGGEKKGKKRYAPSLIWPSKKQGGDELERLLWRGEQLNHVQAKRRRGEESNVGLSQISKAGTDRGHSGKGQFLNEGKTNIKRFDAVLTEYGGGDMGGNRESEYDTAAKIRSRTGNFCERPQCKLGGESNGSPSRGNWRGSQEPRRLENQHPRGWITLR